MIFALFYLKKANFSENVEISNRNKNNIDTMPFLSSSKKISIMNLIEVIYRKKNTLFFRCFKCDLTCELTKRKCICKNVNKACKIGWAIKIFSTQFFSIVACIAISKPVKIRVPKPNTEKIKIILVNHAKTQFSRFFPLTKITQFYSWNHRGQKPLRFHEFDDLVYWWNQSCIFTNYFPALFFR